MRKRSKKWMKLEMRRLEIKLKEAEERTKTAETRLAVAGSEVETIEEGNLKINIIRAETQTYGNYILGYPEDLEKFIDEAKRALAKNMAEGLLEAGVAQIIVKEFGHAGAKTVGLKLFVVPWEQMRTGNKLEIRSGLIRAEGGQRKQNA